MPIKELGNAEEATKPEQRQVKPTLWQTICRILLASHARRPFGEHVRVWADPQQSTLVSATKLRRMVIADDDAESTRPSVED